MELLCDVCDRDLIIVNSDTQYVAFDNYCGSSNVNLECKNLAEVQYLCVVSGCIQQNYEEKQFEVRKQRLKKPRKPCTQNIFESAEYFLQCRLLF